MTASNSPQETPFKQRLALGLLRASAVLPLGVSRALGSLLAWIGIVTGSQSYRVTLRNLEMCYPDLAPARRRRLARASVIQTGRLLCETGAVWLRDYRWLEPRILRVHGRDVLARALATGKGVLLLAPHIGNWEVLGLYLARQAAVTSLYQPPDMATLDKVIRSSREKSGATLVPTNRRGVAALVRALKAGNVSAILPDQVPDKRAGGAFAPFFGHPALTMTLVTNLRRSAGCQVVAGLARRVPGGFEIHFLEAADGIDSDDEARALAALNATVEACVAICPEQYQWEYKRFRKQPDGSNPYKT